MNASSRLNLTPPDPTDSAFLSLVRTFGLLSRVMNPYFAAHGITGAQWGVLRVLQRAEDEGLAGLRQTDLGERLIVRPPSVTGVIGRLLRQGLIARGVFEADQRAKIVSLTAPGRRLLNRVLAGHAHHLEVVLGGLDRTEQLNLHQLLDGLNRHLEELAEAAERQTSTPMRRTTRPRATTKRNSHRTDLA
jgi:DNA-binding MarR family transcriptional regulator